MCGIGGILRTDGQQIPDRWLDAIDARIAHRGPDGCGRFRDRIEIGSPQGKRVIEVALVHRRMSIIDPAGGAQPMVSKRGRSKTEDLVAVVFNGCIYNHRTLRRELEALGHRFVTDHSDTEVLIHGHREWGGDLQRHLEGMYAYAIWDRGAATLTIGRDLFGEKPLYHRMEGSQEGVRLLVVASDATAAGSIPPDAPRQTPAELHGWVRRYLQLGYAWAGRTVATTGVAVANVAQSGRWDTAPDQPAPTIDDLARLIEKAVARRLEADVPLGCFLSGGVDSSLIACFARKHKADLRTFCVRMPSPRYDESEHAARVAAHLGTTHTTLDVDTNPAEDLLRLIGILGQPFGDSSILPTYWVSKATREHVKVALSGDGGDELFVGYERYLVANLLARHWRPLSRIPRQLLRRRDTKSRLHKLGRLGEMAPDVPALGVLAAESIFTQDQIASLLGEAPGDTEPLKWPAGNDALGALRRADLQHYLPDDLLCKVDTASMAVALEVRCPYLDRDLAAAVAATHPRHLIRHGRRKALLRAIAQRHLPRAVLERPKMGFAIPIGLWFRTDFGGLRTLLLDHLNSADPFGSIQLDRSAIRCLVKEHMSGERDHGHRLFALLTLSIWAKSS